MKKKLIVSLMIGTFLISGLSFIGCNKSSDNSIAKTNNVSDSNSKQDETTSKDTENKQESSKDSNLDSNSSSETTYKDTNEDKKNSDTKDDSSISKDENKDIDTEENIDLQHEYEKADKELNELWKVIVDYGADYPDVIEKQKQWIKYKDSKDLATKVKLTQERVVTLNKWFAYQRRIQGEKGYQFAQTHECPSLDWD